MNFAIIIINRHLFVNLLLVMKYHCYIIQPLQSCEIWIPSPMSNFFAESPKLYKRWQGCSFKPYFKGEPNAILFCLQILEPISQEGPTQFSFFFAIAWTHITLQERAIKNFASADAAFGGKIKICWEMYINDQRRRMKFLSKSEMIGGKIRELIDTKYSRKPTSQPSGAIQVKIL